MPDEWPDKLGVTKVVGQRIYFQPAECGFAQGIVELASSGEHVTLTRLTTSSVPLMAVGCVSSAMLLSLPLYIKAPIGLAVAGVVLAVAYGQRKRLDGALSGIIKAMRKR